MKTRIAWMVLITAVIARVAGATPEVGRVGDDLTIRFESGIRLRFALGRDDRLLGLRGAALGELELKSPATVTRPFLIEEWTETPRAWEELRLRDVRVDGERVHLVCALHAADDPDATGRLFVLKDGRPHLDHYRFAHVRLPAEICRLDRPAPAVAPDASGTLEWIIEPVTRNIGGWLWHGWKHSYAVTLTDGRRVNALRELGTWELGGDAVGATLVNLRYRGLGGLACRFDGANAFTTTEILPGAADRAPVVSPAVPGPRAVAGRAEGMAHRHAAWIAQMQRGAGVNWVDFQYRPMAALAAWYETMTAVRSLTEVWPGDREVSQTDCLYFPLTNQFVTTPKLHLALAADLPEHEWRTRWQELDQAVRDQISAGLGFVQTDALPSVGVNLDTAWAQRLDELAGRVEGWRAAGVKRVLVHHPGWFNGRGLRQKETAFSIPRDSADEPDTGGDCSIHDYIPQSPAVDERWRELTRRLNAADMEYWVWITGMLYGTGPVVRDFGAQRFCRNAPDDDFSSGYPGKPPKAGHRGIALRDPEIRRWWEARMDAAIGELGVRGFWADSFQNMFMSQMNYQHPDRAPQVLEWWDWIASASRRGSHFMAESEAFPGLSCSIEVGGNPDDFEGAWWLLPYVTRWYRGRPVPGAGTARADRLYFRSMANKGPICPGGGDVGQIPAYARLSVAYLAALPRMKRPYQLPGEAGVLWLDADSDRAGVLFSFVAAAPPAGVRGAQAFEAHHTYSIEGDDLLAAFGLRRGPTPDPRRAP